MKDVMPLKLGLKEISMQNGERLPRKMIFSLISFVEMYGEQQSR